MTDAEKTELDTPLSMLPKKKHIGRVMFRIMTTPTRWQPTQPMIKNYKAVSAII